MTAATATVAAVATTSPATRRTAGPDRISVWLFTLAAFLVVLALMAWQFRPAAPKRPAPVIVMRRVYETRVVETVIGPSKSTGVTQSVSSSSSSSGLSGGGSAVTRSS